jgi:2-polyprenyl-3-methyl-5-hydroxy-6-metoxy-1,4-benzoquinol methylase
MIDRDPVYLSREKLLLELVSKLSGRILDIGCNTGRTSIKFHKLGFNVFAIDNDIKRISKLQKTNKQIHFNVHDCEKVFSFKDNYFDVIWAGDIIEHLKNTEQFVSEISRIIKKEGVLILSTPYHGLIKNLVITGYNFNKHYNPNSDHLRFYTIKTLKSQLKRNNLYIDQFYLLGRIKPLAKSMFIVTKKQQSS